MPKDMRSEQDDPSRNLITEVRKLLEIVTEEQHPGGVGVASAIEQLDELLAMYGHDLPRDLAHYLSKRSYVKAGIFIDNLEKSRLC